MQLLNLTNLYFSHQIALANMFGKDGRLINRQELLSNAVDKESDLGTALRECYHCLEVGKCFCSSSSFV